MMPEPSLEATQEVSLCEPYAQETYNVDGIRKKTIEIPFNQLSLEEGLVGELSFCITFGVI